MEQLDELRDKINSAKELRSVVKTMKSLAAVSITRYEKAAESLNHYYHTVEMGFQILMRNKPRDFKFYEQKSDKTEAAVVFGSEQGMCGKFNEKIASYAVENIGKLSAQPEKVHIFSLGERVTGSLEDEGLKTEKQFTVSGTLADLSDKLRRLIIEMEEMRLFDKADRIILFHNKPVPGASYEPAISFLLPLNQRMLEGLESKEWKSNTLPDYTMDWHQLFRALLREYFFVTLFKTISESLTAENAARLSSMQAAERNINDRLEELNKLYHRRRQSSITAELLDIVSGFEALTESQGGAE